VSINPITNCKLEIIPDNDCSVENGSTFAQNYECEYCSILFNSVDNLNKHLSLHIEQLNPEHWKTLTRARDSHCHQCLIGFNTPKDLRRHTAEYHSLARPFACDKCDKTFTTKSQLARHTRSFHTLRNL